jgi:hypothetical protein
MSIYQVLTNTTFVNILLTWRAVRAYIGMLGKKGYDLTAEKIGFEVLDVAAIDSLAENLGMIVPEGLEENFKSIAGHVNLLMKD